MDAHTSHIDVTNIRLSSVIITYVVTIKGKPVVAGIFDWTSLECHFDADFAKTPLAPVNSLAQVEFRNS